MSLKMEKTLKVVILIYTVAQLDVLILEIDSMNSMGGYSMNSSPGGQREPRTCVIKKIQERAPLSKALDHLLTLLEKKDPQNFFAWPVTDAIAPGYSKIISKPMDFSTMRQKLEDNEYGSLKVASAYLIVQEVADYNWFEGFFRRFPVDVRQCDEI